MQATQPDPRDPYALATRLRSVQMCGRGCLTGYSAALNRVYLIPLTCKSWSCPRCRPAKQRLWTQIIRQGKPTRWFRLGANPSVHRTPAAAARAFLTAWPTLVRLIRARFGPFEYVKVMELHKSGFPHLHIAYRGPYIPHKWLSVVWRNLVGAPVVWIEKLDDPGRAARYISKYLCKCTSETPDLLPWLRFITRSRAWLTDPLETQQSAMPSDVYWTHSHKDVPDEIESWHAYDPLVVYYNEHTGLVILQLSNPAAGHPKDPAAVPPAVQKIIGGF